MNRLAIVAIAIALLFSAAAAAFSSPEYPLKASSNHRYLADQNDAPVFINGDTPWSLAAQVSDEDVVFYLENRKALGVNSIIVTIPEGYYCDGCRDEDGPQDYYGNKPFTTKNKFTTPNEEYFEHADWMIHKAGEYGIQVLLCPMYTGYNQGEDKATDGWYLPLFQNNSVEDCRWYGEWIGERYRDFPNLIYVIGNDREPGALREKMNAIAEGIRAQDGGTHLMTYHARPGLSATEAWPPNEYPWMTVNCTYQYGDVWKKSLEDYNRKPTMPFFLFESRYENEKFGSNPIVGTVLQVRRQAYESVLSGSCGHHYGNSPVWAMNAAPWYPNGKAPWKESLNDPGATSLLPNIKTLFESRRWYDLVPDQGHTVVTKGYDTDGNYVPAARTEHGETVIAYFPGKQTVSVDMGRISGELAQCGWFSPRDGGYESIGVFPAEGSKEFTPPTEDDWVLLIDDASKHFPAPGE
ncbi:MAG: DUF4038 domain-containing protein [bacterium]|nr:DUF4038 domain-containing protein [bacterium]